MVIPNSRWQCSRLGWDSDLTDAKNAAQLMQLLVTRPTGKLTYQVVFSAWRSSTNVHHLVTPKHVSVWTFQTQYHCTASRCTLPPRSCRRLSNIRGSKCLRLPTLYASIQKKDLLKEYPMILTSGRLVEYEGGGDETRSNPWLG